MQTPSPQQIKDALNLTYGKKYENFKPVNDAQATAIRDLINHLIPKKK